MLRIHNFFIQGQEQPIGIDAERPDFSWQLKSEQNGAKQIAYQLCVLEQDEKRVVWDSGMVQGQQSINIVYQGETLRPCTRYEVNLTVYSNAGDASCQSFFETGMMDASLAAWEGAQWIAAPRYNVCAMNRGVFGIETQFCLARGAKSAGIVFGANDFRLLDASKNEYRIAGENYIRCGIDASGSDPALVFYRVGYAKEDTGEKPFAVLSPVLDEQGKQILTRENLYEFHTLRVEVTGNNAVTWLDGVLVDGIRDSASHISGRVLNPRGTNDVLPYPRLNEIGFYAGEGDAAYFRYLSVRNLRKPAQEYIRETPKGSLYGKPDLFHGRLLTENDCYLVKAGQVTADPSNTSVPMFRSVFYADTEKECRRARLYITARGIYECSVNGKTLSDRVLAPGLTQYDKRMNYQTYDITPYIHAGGNGIGVTVASGWWSDAQTYVVPNYNYFGDKEGLLAKLVVEYTDGSRQVSGTNPSDWRYYGEGPYLYAGLFAGEIYDTSRAEIYRAYSLPSFDDHDWECPVPYMVQTIPCDYGMTYGRQFPSVHEGEARLEGSYDAPVRVIGRIAAKSMTQPEPGVYIYDLKQEMAGVPCVKLHEKRGTKVILRYAEMLYPDLPPYQENAGRLMVENYRDATSTDIYICSGEAEEIYQPKFTFHGYRYIEISGVTHPPKLEEVVSLQYSSIENMTGSLETSNALLNRFAENVKWSQLCNFISIPTDCPQRNERMGWAGDTHVFCHTALHQADLKLFYERNLQAFADLQEPDGRFTEIAPIGGGFGGITYECASIFIVWELYQQYGDIRIVENYYPALEKYMDYMKDQGMPGIGNADAVGPLGDWLAPEETDQWLMWNAFYYRENILMAKLSLLLKKEAEASAYRLLAEKIKAYWNETFIDKESGRTTDAAGTLCDTQCSYALALAYGLVCDRERAAAHLARKTRELEYKVGTGFFGTGLVNQELSRAGYTVDAFRLMFQTECPSWLYPVTQGATTIWEHWDSYTKEGGFNGYNAMNSFNHYSLGSVLSWCYEWILGIQREEDAPAYEHFTLKPQMLELAYAKGSVCSPHGTIRSGWEKTADEMIYTCEIPVNTSASLYLPDGSRHELESGRYRFTIKNDS